MAADRWWGRAAVAAGVVGLAAALAAQDPGADIRARGMRTIQGPILVAEEVFEAMVTSVEDGDSLVLKPLTSAETIVLHVAGVDAPELSQPGGPEAKAFLTRLVLGKTVTVRVSSASEQTARIQVDGGDISATLIRSGMAWHCPRYSEERELTSAEADARTSKRGLWSAPRPTPPWLHRGAGTCWQQKHQRGSDERPDFSGAWTAIKPPEQAGRKVTIWQDTESLTIDRPSEDGVRLVLYKLNGTTSHLLFTPSGPIDIVAKTRWSGPLLIVDERTWSVPGEEATNLRQVLWMDAGGRLNLEISSPRPIGVNDTERWVLRRDGPPAAEK